jgi:hypothetical protein
MEARLFEYAAPAGAVVPSPPALAARVAATCGRLDATLPLSAKLSYARPVLSWSLGPHASGSWAFLTGETYAPYGVAQQGSMTIRLTGVVRLRVRFESPEGRIAVSPPLALEVVDGSASASFARP